MEPLAMEDDICILKHETAYLATESPVSVRSEDELVASHFALVTAYEDIKKRLRDAERENTVLRKRVKQLEDKLYKPEETSSDGQKYVNKAFSAYRGIYIEKKDLQMELNKVKKEKSELEKNLTEQIHAKELELLQLKTEMETSQVMRSLSTKQESCEVGKVNNELENMRLLSKNMQGQCQEQQENSMQGSSQEQEADFNTGGVKLLQSYAELCRTMSCLHVEAQLQTEVMKKLRDKSSSAHRKGIPTIPVQCLDDVERNNRRVNLMAARPPSAPPVPSSMGRPSPPLGPLMLEGLKEDCRQGPWSSSRPPPVGSCAVQLPQPPWHRSSLDESSWSFPMPPKPSESQFWENSTTTAGAEPKSPNGNWNKPY
ncbi:5-azacytidine-induced protein 2 [Scleropages formosus]|uniref:5-azacytidine induced 2 n=1 Tax=Scleropages formosus TaxID=113540 RepID=A0A8C9U201_SCLFO|nr:5-azacytidine-induced protein 2 [Scleropages formosus]